VGDLGGRERRVGGLAGAVKQSEDSKCCELYEASAGNWSGWAHALENEAAGAGLSRRGVGRGA